MKLIPVIFVIVLATTLTLGCVDQPPGNGDGDDTNYSSFTNGEFYVEYPSDWDVTIEKQDQGPDTTFVAEAFPFGPYVYVRGVELDDLTNGFWGWVDSTYQDIIDSDDATVLDYQDSINEALIICNQVKGDDITIYTQFKFILCIDSVYLCTVTAEDILQSDYQSILDHATSSFACAV